MGLLNRTIVQMFNNFFSTEPLRMNGSVKYLVGTKSRGFFVSISEEKEYVITKMELPVIDVDLVDAFRRRLRMRGIDININVNGCLTLVSEFKQEDSIRNVIEAIKTFFITALEIKPLYTWEVWGEMLIHVLGYRITVLSRDYVNPQRTGWREDIIVVLPDDNGWFNSTAGRDNINSPTLSFIRGNFYVYAPFEDGTLRPINVSEILRNIISIAEKVPVGILDKPKDEIELLQKVNEYISALEMMRMSVVGSMPFVEASYEIDKEVLNEIERSLKLLLRVSTFEKYIKMKVAMREAIKSAKKILTGEKKQGVIVSNIRKVNRLGGGKAIYIGKEELRAIKLGDRVIVRVVEEDGKRYLIIEPL